MTFPFVTRVKLHYNQLSFNCHDIITFTELFVMSELSLNCFSSILEQAITVQWRNSFQLTQMWPGVLVIFWVGRSRIKQSMKKFL